MGYIQYGALFNKKRKLKSCHLQEMDGTGGHHGK
jgi:hypothetical protein